jgi:sugar lactone lactonase YvrE
MKRYESAAAVLLVVISIGGCAGGDTKSGTKSPGDAPQTYAVGGTVTGLNEAGLVLKNGATTVTVPAGASTFAFADTVPSSTPYAVTVQSQPSSLGCHVMGGRGTVNGSAVTSIRVSCGTPTLAALAGNFGGDGNVDATGASARFSGPHAVAVDALDNVYVADSGNQTIRRITPQGAVTTFARDTGFVVNEGSTGSTAPFGDPTGVAIDAAGNILVADTGNNSIDKITPLGALTTVAAGFTFTYGYQIPTQGYFSQGFGTIATDTAGNVYVGECGKFVVSKVSPSGIVMTLAGSPGTPGWIDSLPGDPNSALFGCPIGIATDAGGNVYVSDSSILVAASADVIGYNGVRKISPAGVVATLPGDTAGSVGLAVDFLGTIYAANAWDTIEAILPTGSVTTFAGMAKSQGSADGMALAARFNAPTSVAFDSAGNIFVADSGNNAVRKITSTGAVTTFAGAAAETGNVNGSGTVARFSGQGGGIATDASGNVYVADLGNSSIRKVTHAGFVSSLRSVGASGPLDVAADRMGNLYVATATTAPVGGGTIQKITPAGVATTLTTDADFGFTHFPTFWAGDNEFAYAGTIATDAAGNVYVAGYFGETVSKITPSGVVSIVAGIADVPGSADGSGTAAQFNGPSGIATDSVANLYVADFGNHTIRKISSTGVVTTLAGTAGVKGSTDGRGSAASFNNPVDLAVDESDNIYVADMGNNTIRKITPDGVVTTVVGAAGSAGFEPGLAPGVISHPRAIEISGESLYITTANGIAVVQHFP